MQRRSKGLQSQPADLFRTYFFLSLILLPSSFHFFPLLFFI
jgi:hypothetical protein